MAELTINKGTLTGLDPTSYLVAAASGGDQFKNNGRIIFHAKNSDVAATNVTIGAVKDVTVSVPASGRFNDTDGRVKVTYSSVTSLTVGVIEV